jgi:hypothetical protein
MDKRKAYPSIKASDFGKTHKDLINSFTKTKDQSAIERLQEQSNRTLKKIVKDKRKQKFEITKNDVKLTDTNGGNFGEIDEISSEGIGKIKTISNNDFKNIIINKGRTEDYSELNALMHNSKIGKGYIHYVNEDNPFMQTTIRHKHDPSKYMQDLNKVKRVQSFIEKKMYSESPITKYNAESKVFSTISESEFSDSFTRLQEMKEQSIVHTGIKTNNPFMRNMRRENRASIEGLGHGWFGKMRRFTTAFGSPFRLGNFSDIVNLQQGDINDAFDNQYGIDIETRSLKAQPHSIFQVSLKRDTNYRSIFLQQKDDFDLKKYPFLHDNTTIGKLHRNKPFDFTKVQNIENYGSMLKSEMPGFDGSVNASIAKRSTVRNEINDFIDDARLNKKNIFAMNANFEIHHFDDFFSGVSPINYSPEYIELRREISRKNKRILQKIRSGQMTEDQAFKEIVANQKIKFTHIMNDALDKSGNIIEIQELGKTLNAIAQDKGLIPKTGRFGVGTNINFLSKTFLKELEHHDGNLDNFQQGRIAKKITSAIQEIESGKPFNQDTQRWIDTWKNEGKQVYEESTYRMIKTQMESGNKLSDIDPRYNKENQLLSNSAFDQDKMFVEQSKKYFDSTDSKNILKSNNAINSSADKLKKVRMGSLLFGGILLGSAVTNLFTFSGRDDAANTIEGLQHGSPTQDQRQNTTSFGSGYRAQEFHHQGDEDQQSMTWKQLGMTGLGAAGAYGVFKHQASKMRLNDLSYLGKLDAKLDNETLLGRQTTNAQDVLVAGIRRMENTLGGFGKAFGAGDVASIGMYDNATFAVDLTSKEGGTYASFMDKVLSRKLIEEGVDSLMFKKGELFERVDGQYRKIDGKYTLLKTVTNHDLNQSISGSAKSAAYERGISKIDDLAKQPFLILGGKGDWKAAGDLVDSYLHEVISKPLKLLADPMEAIREVFPDFDDKISPHIKKILDKKYMPDIGLDGSELVDSYPNMIKKHAGKLALFGTAAYFGLGTLNWASQYLAPDGTPLGDAGLLGGGAYALRKAHEGYARLSDITGLTAVRDFVDESAPGSNGWQSTIGLTASGAMFGALYGGIQDLGREGTADEKYKMFLSNKEATEEFTGPLKKIFKGKVTKTGKALRIGAAIGFAAALPFTLAGFGAESSAEELAAEYAGEKEIAVRKGRFWETGFTPFEGGEIDYYRPNWYAKLMDDAKDKELYGGSISPLGEAARAITDPYWLEKRRYHSQPYPITGPDGSMMGIFGPIYEASLGRIIKPVATMHASVLPEELLNNTEYDAEALLRKQWNSTLEFIGLRGFAVKAIKENITGSQEIFADPNEARSAKDIDSVVRDFYDLQIGGGILTSEALRRVFQNSDSFQKAQLSASIDLNPLKNTMPSWMPGSDYVTDFKSGDPFMKLKDGYSRLPGAGFSSKYRDLEGVNPEDYSDIYKYKILSDVAYGSVQHRIVKGRLQNRDLTDYEQNIFDEVQAQVAEEKKSEMNVRDPSTYDSFLGRYSAMLTDLARSNPLETLLPISPAHKFLGPPDIEQYMDEQRYSKEYRGWGNPIDDFILPTVSMTMNSLGLGGIDMNDNQDDYFDKVDYVKYSNLAREAQSSGDLKLADQYTVLAQKTYTGKDLYSHPSDVASSLPSRERGTFNYFVGADVVTKQKMLEKVNPKYRDAYQAQLDMQMKQEAQHQKVSSGQRRRTLREIEQRQRAIEARRKAEIQDARSNMPGADWSGWSQQSNTANIKQNYMNNKARDYHDYQPRRSARSSDADAMAAGQIPADIAKPASYTEHYSNLNKTGVENTLVVLRPGLDNSAKVNIKLDRRSERNDALRNWGYTK